MLFADLHAHPFLRPFQNRANTNDLMSRNPNNTSCVWNMYNLPKHNLRNIIGENAGFTTYSEADFTRAISSSVRLINVALYPIEKAFFEIPNTNTLDRLLSIFKLKYTAEVELGYIVSSFSKNNIRKIKSDDYDYFEDVKEQIRYTKDTVPYSPDPAGCVGTVYSNIKDATYTLLKNGSDIISMDSDLNVRLLISIEGGNCVWSNFALANGDRWNGWNFNNYTDNNKLRTYKVLDVPDFRNAITKDIIENNPGKMNSLWPAEVCNKVMDNLRNILGSVKLFSFTMAHHFYNGLAGHCNSLQPLTQLGLSDQSFGIDSELTHLGYMVMNELLKNNVIPDMKHMSWKSRQSYYRYRANYYPQIPILWSHASVSGRKAVGEDQYVNTWNPNPFYQQTINLYDDDIFETVRSSGLIGIELDQRVNGVKDSNSVDTLWKQFQYIAELVAITNRNPDKTVWDYMCLGSDFDGVINPIEQCKTYDDIFKLEDFLGAKIKEYMTHPPVSFKAQDKIDPDEILAKICYKNMVEFVERNFK
ncbi:MAG: hypothetical protein ABI402_17540 [Ferruginibacter sp.]